MKQRVIAIVMMIISLLAFQFSFADNPLLLKDVYAGSNSSYPGGMIKWAANRYLFIAQDSQVNNPFFYVYGLWLTDGTPAGTTLLKEYDLNGGGLNGLTRLNDQTVVFMAYDAAHGNELWVTNGTPAGTKLLKDINPGTASSSMNFGPVVNGNVYMQAAMGSSYSSVWQLWITDGTANGTKKLADSIDYGSQTHAYLQYTGVVRSNIMYFYGVNPKTYYAAFWRSNGTVAGTYKLKTLDYTITQGYYPYDIATDKTVYFAGYDNTNGIELWKTNGTVSGTVMVKNINAGSNGSTPMSFQQLNGKVYFTAIQQSTGTELWVTNGTTSGTKMVKEIYPGTNSGCWKTLGVSGNYLYFVGSDATTGGEPWRTDGTAAGTILLKDIQPGTTSSLGGALWYTLFKDVNGRAYFTATTYGSPGPMNQKFSLYTSDGTPGGTIDLYDDPILDDNITITNFNNVLGNLYFNPRNTTDQMIYKTDGTVAGTTSLDLIPGQTDWASILLVDSNKLFLSLNGIGIGNEPYLYVAPSFVKISYGEIM
ncbi:MAG: ELWxxDGT repeat protein, partial [Chitinophagales bacterium]